MVRCANVIIDALRIDAFSLSINPRCPTKITRVHKKRKMKGLNELPSREHTMFMSSPSSRRRISRTLYSCDPCKSRGETSAQISSRLVRKEDRQPTYTNNDDVPQALLLDDPSLLDDFLLLDIVDNLTISRKSIIPRQRYRHLSLKTPTSVNHRE